MFAIQLSYYAWVMNSRPDILVIQANQLATNYTGTDQLYGFEQRLTTDIYPGGLGCTGGWTEVRPRFANGEE